MKNVMLAYCHPGWVRAEFMQSVLAECTQQHEKRVGFVFDSRTGPIMTIARNYVADSFLEKTGMEWLWMIDTDMVFTTTVLPALLAAADPQERPIVGALCYSESDGATTPTMYNFTRESEGPLTVAADPKDAPPGLVQCDATGCACLLVHRSAFERISANAPEAEHHWFAEVTVDGVQLGEDISFCHRAADAGLPVYVHTGVKVGHMRTLMIGDLT